MKTLTTLLTMRHLLITSLIVFSAIAFGFAVDSLTGTNRLSEKEYLDLMMAAGITLEAEEIVSYSDTTVRFLLKASPLDTLGFTFPGREIVSKRFKFVTSQEDIDSLKNNPVFNNLMMKSRAGHNFWFSQ